LLQKHAGRKLKIVLADIDVANVYSEIVDVAKKLGVDSRQANKGADLKGKQLPAPKELLDSDLSQALLLACQFRATGYPHLLSKTTATFFLVDKFAPVPPS
jgi:hypothetical protein